MNTKYYFKRIINNKIKLGIILLFFIFPVIDIYLSLTDIHNGGSVYIPDLYSFLAKQIYHGLQVLLLWYLPLYFLLIAADDCIEDFKTGYRNILITKWGKKKYFRINIIKGFIIGFIVILLSLVLNMLFIKITFAGGTYKQFFDDPIMDEPLKHPFLTNWIYILVTSFMSGIVSMGAVAIALAIHNRYIVYPIVYLLWDIPSSFDKTIIYAFEPFTEYPLSYVWTTILFVIAINITAVIFSYIKVIKYEQV